MYNHCKPCNINTFKPPLVDNIPVSNLVFSVCVACAPPSLLLWVNASENTHYDTSAYQPAERPLVVWFHMVHGTDGRSLFSVR